MIESLKKCGTKKPHMLFVHEEDVHAAWAQMNKTARKNLQGSVRAHCMLASCEDHGRVIYIGMESLPEDVRNALQAPSDG